MASIRKFNARKAIEVMLYVAERVRDMYSLLKIMYFADQKHLAKYGRLISGDSYIAMNYGPVPSGAYDIIKYVRGDGFFTIDEPAKEAFQVQGRETILPLRRADTELLSDSDMECLDEAIKQYGSLSFKELRERSHDQAFLSASHNGVISLEVIARALPDGELLWDYLQTE